MPYLSHKNQLFRAVAVLAVGSSVAFGQCGPFSDALESAPEVAANGGVINGTVAFAPGINGSAADCSGGGHIVYTDPLFTATSGTVTMWVKKSAADAAGGLFQVGDIGQPRSIGCFYANDGSVFLEVRNNAGAAGQIFVPDVLSTTSWTHIGALWIDMGTATNFFLFIDGRYREFGSVSGTTEPTAGTFELARSTFHGTADALLDEVRFNDWGMLDDEIYAEFVVSQNRFINTATDKPLSTGPVQVVGKQLVVEGQPFTVKGVGYQPTPIGTPISGSALSFMYTDPGIIARDMAILRGMGVNTIRIYSGAPIPDETLLDACYNDGSNPIYVIMGYFITANPPVDYADPATRAEFESGFLALVEHFKDHPAVLAWGIGNENNLGYAGDLADWYALVNDLAEAAFAAEGSAFHPTVVINGGMRDCGDTALGSDDAALSAVDVWGHNAYPGTDFECYFDYFDRLSAKPLILTEFGIDAHDHTAGVEHERLHSEYDTAQFQQLAAATAGGVVFEYSDEWWKAEGSPAVHDTGGYFARSHPEGFANEEWWGIVRPVDNGALPDIMQARAAYYGLRDAFVTTDANLLTNPGFDLQTGSFLGWNTFGNAFTEDIVALSPPVSGKMFGNFSGGFDVTGVFQEFPTLQDESFELSLSAHMLSGDALTGTGPPDDNWALVRIGFFDAAGNEIDGHEVIIADGTTRPDAWIAHGVSATAPIDTAAVQASVLFFQPHNAAGAIFFDDLVFRRTSGSPDIPALSKGAIITMALCVLLVGAVLCRRRFLDTNM